MKTWKIIGLLSMTLASQLVYATEQENEEMFFTPLLTLSGGIAINSDAGASQDFLIGYSQLDYDADHETQVTSVFGALIGGEFPLDELWALQLGVSYYQVSPLETSGTLAQGFNPATTADYAYSYKIRSRQALVEGKLLAEWHDIFYPYISLGLGAAFNEANSYSIDFPASLAITPLYDDHTTTAFTYMVGLGFDVDVSDHVRLGLGYRFTDLGRVKLGTGVYDQFEPTAISETLEQSHLYTQEVLAQLTYLM